ncbi:DUF2642 domain-containing protein [Bacillus sp. FJAT-29790]|uniref:DUF2642 domain-containing protein n=1 Tax=Bacillus sp. FJAT-29790 TaxID=1895002 RepID=UPI0020B425BD|nr:DUF2642 domain-containing protein [Bacillus sp. FJAT-29790]
MSGISNLKGEHIEIEISGKMGFRGILVDTGLDIIVLYDGNKYFYIPFNHIQNIKKSQPVEEMIELGKDLPSLSDLDSISYRKILTNARGRFVEIFVSGNKTIHGYITSVLNDFLVFYSPVFKTMFISLHHIKWIIPYSSNLTPYTLNSEKLPVQPTNIPISRSFEEQLKKEEGKLVVFDAGDHPNKIGLLKSVQNNIVELITADGETTYWKLLHLKMVHLP